MTVKRGSARDRFDISNQVVARSFIPSPQQQAIFDWITNGSGNLIVRAVAGAGKTTTMVEGCLLMSGSVALAAYNKAISVEIGKKLSLRGSRAFAGTFHSFGFRSWRRAAPNVVTDKDKIWKIIDSMDVPENLRGFTSKMVSFARQRAVGVLTPLHDYNAWRSIVDHYDLEEALSSSTLKASVIDELVEEGISLSQQILQRSNDACYEVIDFDDMIYAPLIHGARVYQNDWVLVDEAQDTNPARRALAKKMLKPGGRAIWVGDDYQAIYGFTGADNDSMEIIRREFSCQTLPLTVTYRCPKKIVAHARQWVSHIEAHESAPEGELIQKEADFFTTATIEELDAQSAVLCRYTKPLVTLAFQLIKRRIPCHVEGRDIGTSLIQLTKKWKSAKFPSMLRDRLTKYKDREVQKYMSKGQEQKAESVADRVDTLLVIIDSLGPEEQTMEALRSTIEALFENTPEGQPARSLSLCTVHRSKGREWNRVYLLGRSQLMPSKFARQEWQMKQEVNLIYVAVTRAKQTLVEVSLA